MKLKLFLFSLLAAYQLIAQLPDLERIEPMFWWTGMKNPGLQLIVHGNKIAERSVQFNYAGVINT